MDGINEQDEALLCAVALCLPYEVAVLFLRSRIVLSDTVPMVEHDGSTTTINPEWVRSTPDNEAALAVQHSVWRYIVDKQEQS